MNLLATSPLTRRRPGEPVDDWADIDSDWFSLQRPGVFNAGSQIRDNETTIREQSLRLQNRAGTKPNTGVF